LVSSDGFKEALKKYGYRPDQRERATVTTLEQALLFGNDWASGAA
jgi:hypothetical protein